MKQKLRIISDWPLLIMAIALSIASIAGCAITLFLLSFDENVADSSKIILIQVTFVVALVVLLFGVFLSLHDSVCVVTLSHDTISIRSPFQKNRTVPYKTYSYIYCGCYFHGNVLGFGFWKHYIVFSQVRIPPATLSQINTLKNTGNTFKVRFSKRNYEKLYAILPSTHREKLTSVLSQSNLL